MNDYDVFVVPEFKLDSNYNYDIKIIASFNLEEDAVFTKLHELGFEHDLNFKNYNKLLYYTSVSCLVDLKKWLLNLADLFTEFNITSNLDSINKVKK